MAKPPPCDLDPEVFNLHTAFWAEPNDFSSPKGWRGTHHGCGGDVKALRRCGCGPCREAANKWAESLKIASRPPSQPEPKPPTTAEVGPVAGHVRALIAGGMTRSEIAVAARIDRTTVGRLLRPEVRRVAVDTAEAVLAVRDRLRAVS